jgi:hypothetical protein
MPAGAARNVISARITTTIAFAQDKVTAASSMETNAALSDDPTVRHRAIASCPAPCQ